MTGRGFIFEPNISPTIAGIDSGRLCLFLFLERMTTHGLTFIEAPTNETPSEGKVRLRAQQHLLKKKEDRDHSKTEESLKERLAKCNLTYEDGPPNETN